MAKVKNVRELAIRRIVAAGMNRDELEARLRDIANPPQPPPPEKLNPIQAHKAAVWRAEGAAAQALRRLDKCLGESSDHGSPFRGDGGIIPAIAHAGAVKCAMAAVIAALDALRKLEPDWEEAGPIRELNLYRPARLRAAAIALENAASQAEPRQGRPTVMRRWLLGGLAVAVQERTGRPMYRHIAHAADLSEEAVRAAARGYRPLPGPGFGFMPDWPPRGKPKAAPAQAAPALEVTVPVGKLRALFACRDCDALHWRDARKLVVTGPNGSPIASARAGDLVRLKDGEITVEKIGQKSGPEPGSKSPEL